MLSELVTFQNFYLKFLPQLKDTGKAKPRPTGERNEETYPTQTGMFGKSSTQKMLGWEKANGRFIGG